jgi:hypothetical protein
MVLVDTMFYAALTPHVPYFAGELGLSKSLVGILRGRSGLEYSSDRRRAGIWRSGSG